MIDQFPRLIQIARRSQDEVIIRGGSAVPRF